MDGGHLVPFHALPGVCAPCRDVHARTVARHPFQAAQVLNHHSHVATDPGAESNVARWCIWGAALPAIAIRRQFLAHGQHPQKPLQQQKRQQRQWRGRKQILQPQRVRGLSRPAVAFQDARQFRRIRIGPWPAFFAYVILAQIHQRSLRSLTTSGVAPPHWAVVVGLHALGFALAAFFVSRTEIGKALFQTDDDKAYVPTNKGEEKKILGVRFAVLVVEILSWEALGRLNATGHLALSVALLFGLMLPLCMAASRFLLGRSYAPQAWAGAVVVAAGVGSCNLGNPLTAIASTSEAFLLVSALCLVCLSLVGKEALMSGQRLNVPTVGLLICIAQLVAIARQQYWPPLAAAPGEMAALWNVGSLTYVIVSGLLRVSLLLLIRATSASTLQLLNALAVPFGAAFFTSGFSHNLQALTLASGGAILYLFGQQEQATNYILGQQREEKPVDVEAVEKEEKEGEGLVQEEPKLEGAEEEVLLPKAAKREPSWMDSMSSMMDVTSVFQQDKKNPKDAKNASNEISKNEGRKLVNSLAVPLGAAILTTSGVGQAMLVASGALYLLGQREERKRELGPPKSKKEKTDGNTEESSTEGANQQQS